MKAVALNVVHIGSTNRNSSGKFSCIMNNAGYGRHGLKTKPRSKIIPGMKTSETDSLSMEPERPLPCYQKKRKSRYVKSHYRL